MQQEIATNTFLSRTRFWTTTWVVLHFAVWVVFAYTSGGLQFEICTDRAKSWDYWHIWGNAFGLLAPAIVYWTLWHITYVVSTILVSIPNLRFNRFGVYFWFGFIGTLGFGVYHGVCAIFYISDQINCAGTPSCFGCANLPTDTFWIVNWVFVGVMCVMCFLECFMLGMLRSKTEFGLVRNSEHFYLYRFTNHVVPTDVVDGKRDQDERQRRLHAGAKLVRLAAG
jgi:hypothetical protein